MTSPLFWFTRTKKPEVGRQWSAKFPYGSLHYSPPRRRFVCSRPPALAAPPEIANVIKSEKPYGEGHMNFLFIKAYNARLWTDAPTWSMDAPFAMEITYGMGFDTDDLTGTHHQGNEDGGSRRSAMPRWPG